jgi:hypothetical protein
MCRFTLVTGSSGSAEEEEDQGPAEEGDDSMAPVRFMPAYYVD